MLKTWPRLVPPLKKRTRHWCNHGWSGSMATALLTDWSINRYFSETKKRRKFEMCDAEIKDKGRGIRDLDEDACRPFLK